MKKLPRIKTGVYEVYSQHGNLPVVRDKDGLDDGDYGGVNLNRGVVKIHPETDARQEWQTYWHEAIHTALFDSGQANYLTKKVEEGICDALGSYLTGMMQAGMITVHRKKQSEPSNK